MVQHKNTIGQSQKHMRLNISACANVCISTGQRNPINKFRNQTIGTVKD